MSRRFDLVAFDVDGTLVHHPEDKTVWEVLNHRFTGSDDQNVAALGPLQAGKLSYAEWVALDIASWRDAGATRDDDHRELRRADPGRWRAGDPARAEIPRRRAWRSISGTLDLLLDTLFPDHPFDEVYTNRIAFDGDGRIAHWHATPFDMDGKGVALRSIALREDIPLAPLRLRRRSRERRRRGAPGRLFDRVQSQERRARSGGLRGRPLARPARHPPALVSWGHAVLFKASRIPL